VTRDDALAELRRLLRVHVLDVHRDGGDPGYRACSPARPEYRAPRPPMWWLTVERTWDGAQRRVAVCVGPSGSVRNPRKLNGWAVRLGRSPNLPPLTAADGHLLVKLLHEIINERTDPDAR